MVRSSRQFPPVSQAGGIPVLGDVLDRGSLRQPVAGCDVVIHLAQPSQGSIEDMRETRVDGGRNLAAAIVECGTPRFVIGSGYWVYRTNPGILEESSPLSPLSISKVNFETEELAQARAARGDFETVVVRPGMVYGKGSWFMDMVKEIRAGSYVYIDDGSNYLSPVHWEDVGGAYRTICENWHPGETYLVVDDMPVTTKEFAEYVSDFLHAPAPRSIRFEEASRRWGTDLAVLNVASRRASNAKIRSIGWNPRYKTFREGVTPFIEQIINS
jgi:nucleoside-diphosphate-sugar epimerase